MEAMELTPEPILCCISGASVADTVYVLGILKPIISPAIAPMTPHLMMNLRLFQSFAMSSIKSISCS